MDKCGEVVAGSWLGSWAHYRLRMAPMAAKVVVMGQWKDGHPLLTKQTTPSRPPPRWILQYIDQINKCLEIISKPSKHRSSFQQPYDYLCIGKER